MPTKHFYSFRGSVVTGARLNRENWDSLRTNPSNADFSFEPTRDAYVRACARRMDYSARAREVLQVLSANGLGGKALISLGAGKGVLEWHLKQQSQDLRLQCTDFTPAGIAKLAEYLPSSERVFVFDIEKGNYQDLEPGAVLLMHRISTEFDLATWRSIVKRIHAAGIEAIVFIPTEVATWKIKLFEILSHVKALFLRRHQVFCGWLYSDDEIRSFFTGYNLADFRSLGETAIYVYVRED